MESNETPSRYPYLISVRGGRPRPARRDGSYYVCAYPTHLGLWWAPRDVKVLNYDPHRDFYQELRAAYLAAHPEAAPDPPASDQVTPGQPAAGPGEPAGLADPAPALFERVETGPVARPAPPGPGRPSFRRPGVGW